MLTESQIQNIYGISRIDADIYYRRGFKTYENFLNDPMVPKRVKLGIKYDEMLKRDIPTEEILAFLRLWKSKLSFQFTLVGNFRLREPSNRPLNYITMVTSAKSFQMEKQLLHLPNSKYFISKSSTFGNIELSSYLIQLNQRTDSVRRLLIYYVEDDYYAVNVLLRTGPNSFNNLIFKRLREMGYDIIIDFVKKFYPKNEADIFRFLEIGYVKPENRSKTMHLSVIPSSSSSSLLSVKPQLNVRYPLAQLICSGLGISMGCNDLSIRIAENLIRVSSVRIFSNPYQSIMEPITNAIDAAGSSTSVSGKFGLGVYSLFYWPLNRNQSKISYISRDKNLEDFWSFTVSYSHSDHLSIAFNDPQIDNFSGISYTSLYPKNSAGTTVILENLDISDLFHFEKQIAKFSFVKSVPIVQVEGILLFKAAILKGEKQITIMYERRSFNNLNIVIHDVFGGISRDILFNSLLVPTSSTKKLEYNQTIPNEVFVSIHQITPELRGLAIMVGEIVVMDIEGPGIDLYLIQLPINTEIPVSRDDIILSEDIIKLLERALEELVTLCVNRDLDLQDLIDTIDNYIKYTDQPQAASLAGYLRTYILNFPDLILLPSRKVTELLREATSLKLNYLSNISIIESRRKLDILIDGLIGESGGYGSVENVRLVPMDINISPTNAGIPGYIFLSSSMTLADLINSYSGAILRLSGQNKFFENNVANQTGILFETRLQDEFPFSVLIYEGKLFNQPFSLNNLVANYPRTKIIHIIHPYISNWNQFIDLFSEDSTSLYYAIEAWILNLGENVIINVMRNGFVINIHKWNGRYCSPYIPEEFLPPSKEFDIKKNTIEAITTHCLIAAYTLYRLDVSNIKIAKEYLASLSQFFTQIQINVPQGTKKRFWIGRLTPYGWLDQNYQRHNMNSSNNNMTVMDWIENPKVLSMLQEGFFQSLRENLDDDLNLKQDILLLDPRHFPNIALENFHLKISAHDNELSFNGVDKVVLLADNGFEATLILDVLTTFLNINTNTEADVIFRDVINDKEQSFNILKMVRGEIRKRFPPSFFTQYMSEPPSPQNISWIINTVHVPLAGALEIFLTSHNTYLSSSSSGPSTSSICDECGKINLSDLIGQVFAQNIPPSLTPLQLSQIPRVAIPENINKLQLIKIAVNEGTTKGLIASILTELIQNSLDAMKENPHLMQPAEVTFESGYSSFLLVVKDFVGIPDFAWPAFLIPFLSSKSSQSTGEMGTGLFNIYRWPVREVTIASGNTFITAIPIHEGTKVIDIEYQFTPNPYTIGTIISIRGQTDSSGDILQYQIDYHVFAQNYTAALAGKVKFGNISHRDFFSLLPIYESNVGNVYLSPGNPHQSVVLTNNVPFDTLFHFLSVIFGKVTNGELATNLVININKGYYVPVQGRNRLNLNLTKMNVLKEFLLTSLTMATFCKINRAPMFVFDKYLPGASSNSSLDQFTFHSRRPGFKTIGYEKDEDNWSLRNLLLDEDEPTKNFTYGEIFSKLIEEYQLKGSDPNPRNNLQFILREIDYIRTSRKINGQSEKFGAFYLNSCFSTTVDRWFDNKKAAIIKNDIKLTHSVGVQLAKVNEIASSSSESSDSKAILLGIFQKFVASFFLLGSTLKVVKGLDFSSQPTIYLGIIGNNRKAIYEVNKNRIIVDETYFEKDAEIFIEEWITYLNFQKDGDVTKARMYMAKSKINAYLGNTTGSSATLPHEIIHVLTKTEHRGAHDPLNFTLSGKQYKAVDFEKAVFIIYSHLLEKGLVEWLKI